MLLAKKTFFIPIILFFAAAVLLCAPKNVYAAVDNYEPRLTTPSSSNPYYSSKLNRYFKTGSPMPNCVAYAYGRIYEMNGEEPLITHGSAESWYKINKDGNYYEYGNEARLGAVACWSNHVAIVEKINEDKSITVSESHWGGKYFDTKTIDSPESHFGQKFYGYIYAYNGGLSKELEKRLVNATKYDNSRYMTPSAVKKSNDALYEVTNFGIEDSIKPENGIDDLFLMTADTKIIELFKIYQICFF